MKKFSKIFCLILAVALVCTGLMLVVSADETTFDLASAVTEAEAGNTVKLTGNAQIDSAITVDKNLTIDLAGYTLASTAEVMFEVKGDVTFTITGTGTINVDGMVFRTESGKAPVVTVAGTAGTTGIKVNHTGSKSMYITYTYTGTYLYKNIDVNTTYVGSSMATASYAAFLANDSNASAAATFVTLESVEFHSLQVVPRNPGIAILSLSGVGSKLTIKDSALYTSGSGIDLSHAKAVDENGTASINAELAYVENSVISCVCPNITGSGYRNFALILDKWSGTNTAGTFTLKDSLLEGTCRMIYANDADNIKVQVNAVNSTIQHLRVRDADNVQLIDRYVNVNLDKDSRIVAIKDIASFGKLPTIKASVGTRINTLMAANKEGGIYYPDGTYNSDAYKWVYDPITDPAFPYVLVEAGNSTSYLYKNSFNFDNVRFDKDVDYKLGAANAKITVDGAIAHYDADNLFHRGADKTTLVNSGGTGMQWDVKMGSLYYGIGSGTSNYVKYVVTNDVISGKTNTVSGDSLKSSADPYLIVGGGFNYTQNLAHVKGTDGYKRTKLAVLNFDFGTDSEKGYPRINTQTQSRYGTDNKGRSYDAFQITNDGTVTNKLQDPKPVTLKPVGEWNHLTVVFYTDTTQGAAYYFLNGEYIGYSYAYNSGDDAYIMGVRFNVVANVNHKIDSSICFDNVSFVAYENYLKGEEDGQTSKNTAANYVVSAPANAVIKENLSNYDVNGLTNFDSFSDAVDFANNVGTAVDLNDNYTATVTANGTVDAGDHKFNYTDASYGFVKEGTAYIFNEDYKYDTKWYIGEVGNLEEMFEDENYVTTTVKLGHTADKDAIWTEETPNWNNFTVFTQNGWAYEYDSEISVTPFVPTLADLEAATEAGGVATMYPSFGAVAMASYLKNASGNVAYYMNDAETTDAYHALKNGETLVLLKDFTATKGNALFHTTEDTPVVIALDLNGHKFSYRLGGAVAWVGNNTTLNVYSSQPGGHISSYYHESSTNAPNSQRMFGISPIANKEGVDYVSQCDNAHINIGTFGDIPGSNMKISGGVLLEGINGDENCSINMDGVLAECVRPTSSGMLMARYYNGEINVTNSIFVYDSTSVQLIDIKDYSGVYYTPTVTVDGCSIMGASLAGNADSNFICSPGKVAEGSNHKTIVIKNVVSTKRVNPTGTPSLIDCGDNITGYKVQVGSGIREYNAPITFESLGIPAALVQNGYYEFVKPAVIDGELTEQTVYIVENGNASKAPEGATVVELSAIFQHKITNDVVKVIWNNLDGTAKRTETFAKGGVYDNATSLDIDDYALTAVKLVHDGTWTGIPAAGTVLTENMTVTPGYTVASNVAGLKANLSLYSDFLVNLYVPAAYAQYVKVNGADITANAVTLGEASFVKATVAKNAKEASSDAVFEIAITEGEYTATKTVKISIADYASQILAGNFADTDKVLMYYMLNYAAEAAEYLTGEADAELVALLTANAQWNVINVAKNYANAVETTGLDAIFTSSGITLGEAPAFTFTPNGKFTGTVTVTYGDGNVRTFTVHADSTAKLTVEGMKIYNFGTNLTVTAVGTVAGMEDEQTVVGTNNLDTYAKYHTENAANAESATAAESAEALDLINALYDYVKVAEQYKAGTLTLPEKAPAE